MKKELIILIVSMIILTSIIFTCYILLTNKYGNITYVSINHYFEIGDMVDLINLIYFIMLVLSFVISNYKIFFKKRKATLSLILLNPLWFLIFIFISTQAVAVCMVQEIDIPRYYLAISSWNLASLILYLIPTYYFRFKYYSYFEKNELKTENST
jgi:hypothetical protein